MMLNEWSDRDPDPPGWSGCSTLVAIIVACAVLVLLFNLAMALWGD